LIARRERIVRFPFDSYWMDIGCHADYLKAAEDFSKLKESLLRKRPPVLQKELAEGEMEAHEYV
jgi:NDP-sugar pyrophosphorylase family protein